MQKRLSGYKTIIVTLILLVVGSMLIGISLAYFSNNDSLDKVENEKVQIVATDLGSTAYSLKKEVSVDQKLDLQIRIPTEIKSNTLRVKLNLNNGEIVRAKLNENWQQEEDGYCYYKNAIHQDETIEFSPEINLENTNENINIIVETNYVLEKF